MADEPDVMRASGNLLRAREQARRGCQPPLCTKGNAPNECDCGQEAAEVLHHELERVEARVGPMRTFLLGLRDHHDHSYDPFEHQCRSLCVPCRAKKLLEDYWDDTGQG